MKIRTNKRLVDQLIECAFLRMVQNPRHAKPGELISKLPADMREQCKTLTSKDFDHRLEPWMCVHAKY